MDNGAWRLLKGSTLASPSSLRIFDLINSSTLLRRASSRNADVCSYRVRTPAGYSLVAVKNVRSNATVSGSLRREYTALQEINDLAGEALHDSVPRPLLLLENEGTIVLSLVLGVPLDRMLRRDANVLSGYLNIITVRRLETIGYHIGEWLRTFHMTTRAEDEGHDHDGYSLELKRLIPRCYPFGLSSSALETVASAALSLSDSLTGCLSPAAATHGDFIPQNILLQKGTPRVIDFASYRRKAPIYTDLAHFIGYLMILGRKPVYSPRILESVARHFLVGYRSQLNPDLLRLYLVKAILRIVSDGRPQPSGSNGKRIEELLLSIAGNELSRILPIAA
jgi:hypothetical protein